MTSATGKSDAEMGTHAAAPAPARAGDQTEAVAVDLFESLDGLADVHREHAIKPPAPRGPGRPPGTPNRSSQRMRDYLAARGYRDPMEFLAAIVTMDEREIVKLGIKPVDALSLQLRAADALLPYVHQRMPAQVEVKHEGARPLMVVMPVSNPEQYQGDSAKVVNGSHGDRSHDEG